MLENANNLIEGYKKGCDYSFTKLFNSHSKIIIAISNEYTKHRIMPFSEMYSELQFQFYRLVEEFDVSRNVSFESFVRFRLNQKALDYLKSSNGNYYKKVSSFSSESDAATFDVADDFEVEREVVNKVDREKDTRPRLIVSALLKGSDSLTTAIVNVIQESESPLSYRQIAKKVGASDHKVVKRRLDKLKRKYSALEFGDINNYLAV